MTVWPLTPWWRALLPLAAITLSGGCVAGSDDRDEMGDCAGEKCDGINQEWDLVFAPPEDGEAYVFPEQLEEGLVWNAEFEVVRADEIEKFIVIQGPHLVLEPEEWSERILIEEADPWGSDLAFAVDQQEFDADNWLTELGTRRWAEHLWKLDIRPLGDRVHYHTHYGTWDESRSEGLRLFGWSPQSDLRYFIKPYVIDSGFFSDLEGNYTQEITVTCEGEQCAHVQERDSSSLEYMPTFCTNFADEKRWEPCEEIRSQRR